MLSRDSKTIRYRIGNKGVSIYKVITVVGLLALAFILILPQFMDIQRKENTEECIKNMREIENAVIQYMNERGENFSGDTHDLNRTGYLRKAVYVCPSGTPESNYYIQGNYQEGKVIVRCPLHLENPDEFADHILPTSQ